MRRLAPVLAGMACAFFALPLTGMGQTISLRDAAPATATRYVQGVVRSAGAGLPLSGVTVTTTGGPERRAASTALDGSFRIAVPAGATHLVAARLGFSTDTVAVAPHQRELELTLQPAAVALDEVLVRSERSYAAASSDVIRQLDVQLRPRSSSQELLRLVPGLVITQHGGGGKAEQMFLRGFDADHGTDVAVSVDGVPVNMVSHAHGQGYADLHFLMPEVVERVDVRKGPYDARDGDFATAGAVLFRTRDRIDGAVLGARFGSFGSGRLLAMAPFGGDPSRAGGYVALAGALSQGPFEQRQDHRRVNAFGKLTAPLFRATELVVSASGFDSRWDQSGQVPERAVASGSISRFGSIDDTEGGNTSRYDGSVRLRSRTDGASQWEVQAFGTYYDFQLFSNFTFFLDDPDNGDGIEQTDSRYVAGVQGTYSRLTTQRGREGQLTLGGGARNDFADITLSHQRERVRLKRWVDAGISQSDLFAFAQQEIDLSSRLRLQLGLRGDVFRFDVDHRQPSGTMGMSHASGREWRGIVSPKANLAFQLGPSVALYGNAGSGFHSNDARDVLAAGAGDRVLPRAIGTELGARHTWRRGSVAVAVWRLDLQSELVYVGDEGVTEPSGRTRRTGVDMEGRVQLMRWLWLDADLNVTRGRFRDLPEGENLIPLAPTRTSTGGLTIRDLGAVGGGIRYRHVGSRSANESNSVRAHGHSVWEIFAGYQHGRVQLYAAADNLFSAEWNEAQFDTESRLPGEPLGISELHFTPGAPRGVQVGLEYRF